MRFDHIARFHHKWPRQGLVAGTLNLFRNRAVGFVDWLGADVTTAKKLGAILCSRQILNTGLLDVPLSTTLNDAPGSSE
jgi:hypothetical protein